MCVAKVPFTHVSNFCEDGPSSGDNAAVKLSQQACIMFLEIFIGELSAVCATFKLVLSHYAWKINSRCLVVKEMLHI